MSTLPKSLIIAFLAVSIFVSGLNIDPVGAQNTAEDKKPVVELTDEEKAWIKEHPVIRVGVDHYPPLEIVDGTGNYEGLGAEYLRRVGENIGLNFKILTGLTWTQIQEGARNGTVDVIPVINNTPERRKFLLFTDGYLQETKVVITRLEHPAVTGVADLKGKTMAVSEGYSEIEDLNRDFPSIKQVVVHNTAEELKLVASGQADACQGSLAVISYYIRKNNIVNLKVAGPSDIGGTGFFAMGSRKDWPILNSILQKGLKSIGEPERIAISRKWIPDLGDAQEVSLELTSAEQTWLKQRPVMRLGIHPSWAPVEYFDAEGRLAGITSDKIRILSEKLGTRFEAVGDLSWSEVLQQARQGKIDVISAIVKSDERADYLLFTKPYLNLPLVIVTRDDTPVIEGIQDLEDKTIAVVEGYITNSYLKRDYPNQQLLLFETLGEALQAVDNGKADALIDNAAPINLARIELDLTRLTVAATTPYSYELSIGVRKDWPEFIPILEKILASISEREKRIIKEKWVDIRFQKQVDWQAIFGISLTIVLIAGIIVTIIINSNRRLVSEVKQRRDAEKALAKARDAAETANQAKSLFLANMSHELRTPLNAILGFSGILRREGISISDQQEKLAIINRSGQHLLAMINDVLDLSKIEAGRIELQENLFDLVALVKEVSVMIQSRASEKGLYVTVEAGSISVPYVKSDMGKLRQILINLLGNAVKFSDEGGVTIRCDIEPIPEEPKRCNMVIEVEDTGPGIEPARQERIFEPFVQGIDAPVRKGTGLGLAISKKFVELMGGTIELQSEVGKGSLFRLRLPAEIAEAKNVKTPPDDKPRVIGQAPTQKIWRVLIADDNWENLLLLKSLLEEVGFFVLEATNGKEAVEAFKKESPDLIWIDMRMPVMDGYEAVRQIRQSTGGDTIPIIAITASAFSEQRHDILSAGCDDTVFKPYQEHEIFEMMARFLDIEYVYEQPGDAAPTIDATELTSAMLGELPPELLQDLDKTTLVANREAILEVIERIQKHAPETTEHLRALVQNFEFERIRELLAELG